MPNQYQTLTNLQLCDLTKQAQTWARQAGQIALPKFRQTTVETKADNTLVTPVDLEIEQFLLTQIQITYPEHHILTEEKGILPGQADSPYTWVIDPLDGTTVFARGLPGWGISMALLDRGQPIFGLFYMPLLDDLTYSCAGHLYGFCRGRPMRGWPDSPHPTGPACPHPMVLGQQVQPDWANHGFLAITAGAHQDFQIDVPRTRALGSIGASLIYTARAAATAAFIPKAYLWDLAAGALLLQQAGGELRYLSGEMVNLEELLDGRLTSEPILAGEKGVVEELRKVISRPSSWSA